MSNGTDGRPAGTAAEPVVVKNANDLSRNAQTGALVTTALGVMILLANRMLDGSVKPETVNAIEKRIVAIETKLDAMKPTPVVPVAPVVPPAPAPDDKRLEGIEVALKALSEKIDGLKKK